MTPQDIGNGFPADALFGTGTSLTFADIIAQPRYNDCDQYSVTCELVPGLTLPLPVISAPMDTVTEWRTAVEIALGGGFGVIHTNLDIATSVEQVERVKRSQMGIVTDPICRRSTDRVTEVDAVKKKHGFSTLLITLDGKPGSHLLGLVAERHSALAEPEETLGNVMIRAEDLVTAQADNIRSWSDAKEFLRRHPMASKVPIVCSEGTVVGMFTDTDVVKMKKSPHAVVDPSSGQLLVGAAVSTHEQDRERIEALLEAGVDLLLIDSAQGSTKYAVEQIRFIRRCNGDIPIVAGNVVTPAQAAPLLKAGANILRVGMGIGSICTTQTVTGVGRGQLSAIYHVAKWVRESEFEATIIADGGIASSGDMFSALACGASAVMLGGYLAGHDETPAEVVPHNGFRYKRYRGMGSPAALVAGGQARYGASSGVLVHQGVEGLVPASGLMAPALTELLAQLTKSMEYVACDSLADLHARLWDGTLRFELRSHGAQREGDVHNLIRI